MHYNRAPIAEAVIDLQVSFAAEPSVERIERFAEGWAENFPHRHRINSLTMAVAHNGDSGGVSGATSSKPLGIRLTNTKGDRVVQIRQQGFSYSHLPPYSDWPSFVAEMRPLWERFVAEFAPSAITRSAVRYINRIVVPEGVDLDKYLNITPRTLDTVCPVIEGYFMQLVLPQTDVGPEWRAIINTGLESSPKPDAMTVLLDVDLFCEKAVPVDDQIWNLLEQLRTRKNEIFEAAITDEVRRTIE